MGISVSVINELDGISKATATHQSIRHQHSPAVGREAANALDFLESQFESRNKRLKAVTVTGTELSSIAFRTEESDKEVGVAYL